MKDNKKKTTHSSSFGRLWSYLQVYRFPLYLAIFLKIISVIMSVIEPVVIGLAITELTKNTLDIIKGVAGAHINVSYVGLVLVFYLLRGLIYELASYYSNYFMTNAVQATVQDMRNEMIEKINRTSVSYFDKQQFGDLLGRFTSDVETVSNALQQSFLQVVNAIFTLALVIGTVLYLNLQLGAVFVITIPISYFGARFIMSKSQPYFKQQADALGTLNGFVQENLTGFNVIKLFGREGRSLDDFKEITEDLQKVGFKANFISGLMMPFLNGLSDLTYLIVAVLGGLQVLAGRLTIGNMQVFVQYVWQINQPIQNLTQLAGQLQSAKSSLDRIFQLMDEPDEANDATEVLEGDLTGQVIFNHVDFQYVADKPLIRDFNLEVILVKWWLLSVLPVLENQLLSIFSCVSMMLLQVLSRLMVMIYATCRVKIIVNSLVWCFRMLGSLKELSRKIFVLVILRQLMKKLLKQRRLPMWITLSVRCLVATTWK